MDISSNLCKLCQQKESRYVCPRCNVPYCSLPCYQSDTHVQCSESFYKDCVVEQISQDQLNPQSQKSMIEILHRVQKIDSQFEEEGEAVEIDSDDESDTDELVDRLAGVDLDDADKVWEKLTDEERKQFEELIKSGDITNVLPSWEPWWNKRENNKLIEDLDQNIEEINSQDTQLTCPKVADNIQPLSKLCGSRIVEGSDENQLKDDVQKLVAGPSGIDQSQYVLAALSDTHRLFTCAKQNIKDSSSVSSKGEFSKKFHTSTSQILSKSNLNKHLKKLEFYLSWTKECF